MLAAMRSTGAPSRREVLRLAATAGALACVPARAAAAPVAPATPTASATSSMLTRQIPRTKEALPAIGLGTWQAFDVDPSGEPPIVDVVRAFFALGGRLIDSSPMYGKAETVVGNVLAALEPAGGHVGGQVGAPFFATKVWTRGAAAGASQMEHSRQVMRAPRIDLMQIHNLLDWQTHLPILRAMKQKGTIRYLGVTHYSHRELPQIERMMKTEALDFIQVPYNILDRTVEARILPAAADTGTAVIVMRPFEEGALFHRVRGKPLPGWAAELACTSWSQVFLKFILAHPAVTCPIPATRDPAHLADNMKAGLGHLPDADQRKAMIAALAG
jgi:diketogulonate reductase-like aldo/keto reductase